MSKVPPETRECQAMAFTASATPEPPWTRQCGSSQRPAPPLARSMTPPSMLRPPLLPAAW